MNWPTETTDTRVENITEGLESAVELSEALNMETRNMLLRTTAFTTQKRGRSLAQR